MLIIIIIIISVETVVLLNILWKVIFCNITNIVSV